MDRIFSTRMNESVIALISSLARTHRKSKKRIVEEALQEYAESHSEGNSVFAETSGAWIRDESPASIHQEIRDEFERAMRRRQT